MSLFSLKLPKYRQKMVLILILLLMPPIFVNAYITIKARLNLKEVIYDRIRVINQLTIEQINSFVNFEKERNSLIAEDITAYHSNIPQKICEYLQNLKNYEKILVLTPQGKIMASTLQTDIGTDKSDENYFQDFKKQIFFTDAKEDDTRNPGSFYITTPLRKKSEELWGILVSEISYTRLKEYLKNNNPETDIYFYLINKEGKIILNIPDNRNVAGVINIKDIEKETEKPEEGNYKNFKGDEVIGVHKNVGFMGWILISEIDTKVALINSTDIENKNRWINFLIILFVLLVGYFASRSIDAPLREFNIKVTDITDGNLKARVEIKTGDELEQLGSRFNSMVEHLEVLYNDLEKKVQERTRELEEANNQLQALSRLKSEFLANMSHELRTPLNSIIGFSELMADKVVGELNEDQEQCVSDILESGKHLLQLINNILDLSKVEAGKMELHCENFSLQETIGLITRTLTSLVEKKNQTLLTEIDEKLPDVYADQGKFKQIMLNLLSNAIKFTPENGKITVRAEKKAGDYLISVTDTGIGIKEEDIKYIFEEFRQVDGSYTREQQGTGLGLSLTKKFIELHGGKIWVESTAGKGTTFYFTIPEKHNQT